MLLHATAAVFALSTYGALVLLLGRLGIARHGSPLLFAAAIGLGLGYWIARPIWDRLNPTLMKKADENAARRFSEKQVIEPGGTLNGG